MTDPIEQGKTWVENLIKQHASETPVQLQWSEERAKMALTCTASWRDGQSVSVCVPVCYLYVTNPEEEELARYLTNRVTVALRAAGRRRDPHRG